MKLLCDYSSLEKGNKTQNINKKAGNSLKFWKYLYLFTFVVDPIPFPVGNVAVVFLTFLTFHSLQRHFQMVILFTVMREMR